MVAGPGTAENTGVGGFCSPPIPSGRSISFTGRSGRAIFQLPSPMWLMSTESSSQSIAYISEKCASPIIVCAAHISEAVLVSPSAA